MMHRANSRSSADSVESGRVQTSVPRSAEGLIPPDPHAAVSQPGQQGPAGTCPCPPPSPSQKAALHGPTGQPLSTSAASSAEQIPRTFGSVTRRPGGAMNSEHLADTRVRWPGFVTLVACFPRIREISRVFVFKSASDTTFVHEYQFSGIVKRRPCSSFRRSWAICPVDYLPSVVLP